MCRTTDTMPRWQENDGGGRSPATRYRLIHWVLKGGGRSVWSCEDFCVLKYPRIIISTQETANKYPRKYPKDTMSAQEHIIMALPLFNNGLSKKITRPSEDTFSHYLSIICLALNYFLYFCKYLLQ